MLTPPNRQNAIIAHQSSLPPGLLADLCPNNKPFTLSFSFTKPERTICRKYKIQPSKWVEENRVIEIGEYKGSKCDLSITPWARDMIDASFFPSVRRIVNCKNVQSAGSTFIHSCLAYAIANEPGDILIALSNQDRARKVSKDRVGEMIKMSPRLASYMTGKEDDFSTYRIRLLNSLIYMGWSGSATSLGDFPCKYVVKEEADKWEEYAHKNEAGTHDSIDQRVTTFEKTAKIWDNSTPTVENGHIWTALTTATQFVFDYWVKCPDCRQYQVMIFRNIKWEGGSKADPVLVESKNLARYVCVRCGTEWDDYKRNQATKDGHWRGLPTKVWEKKFNALKEGDAHAMDDSVEMFKLMKQHHPKVIGFHPTAWFSTFVSLSRSAAAFLNGQGSSPKSTKKLKSFLNNFAAEPWKAYKQKRQEEAILTLRDDRPEGMVPGNNVVAGLVAGIDTQDNGFYVEIRAFGFGLARDSWGVRFAFVDSFDGVKRILWKDVYKDAAGNEYPVLFALQDAMGHRTDEVYNFCVENRGLILPTKGDRVKSQPFTFSNLEYFPGSKKAIPDGLQLININTKYYKDILSGKIDIKAGDPGAWNLHADTTEEYASQMIAETTDDHGFWINPQNKPNHGWDTGVLCLVASDYLGMKFWSEPDEEDEDQEDYEATKSNYVNG